MLRRTSAGTIGRKLVRARTKAGSAFSQNVGAELADLGMQHTTVRVAMVGEFADADLLEGATAHGPVPVDFEVRALRADVGAPLAGARCAVELESGKYLEQLTNAEGVALFELYAWPGTLSVTCAKGHGTSWVGLRRDDHRRPRAACCRCLAGRVPPGEG